MDECSTLNGSCEHICINTLGSFGCSCRRGWQLHIDGYTCVGQFTLCCSATCFTPPTCLLGLFRQAHSVARAAKRLPCTISRSELVFVCVRVVQILTNANCRTVVVLTPAATPLEDTPATVPSLCCWTPTTATAPVRMSICIIFMSTYIFQYSFFLKEILEQPQTLMRHTRCLWICSALPGDSHIIFCDEAHERYAFQHLHTTYRSNNYSCSVCISACGFASYF